MKGYATDAGSSYLSSGSLFYYVKSGICYVSGEFTLGSDATYVTLFSGLPKPVQQWYFSQGGNNGIVTPFSVTTGGNLQVYYAAASTKQRYDISFSYPVADDN